LTHSGQTKSAIKHWLRETGNNTHGFLDSGRGWIGDRLSFRFYAHGYLAGKLLKGIDIREHGSKATGATNVLRGPSVNGLRW
jgi:hypothetical protein